MQTMTYVLKLVLLLKYLTHSVSLGTNPPKETTIQGFFLFPKAWKNLTSPEIGIAKAWPDTNGFRSVGLSISLG